MPPTSVKASERADLSVAGQAGGGRLAGDSQVHQSPRGAVRKPGPPRPPAAGATILAATRGTGQDASEAGRRGR